MKQVFISLGMTGRQTDDVLNDIDRAIEYIAKNILNPDDELKECIFTNFNCITPIGESRRLYCLGEAIKRLGECDVCYFVRGWEKYKGCRVEREVCKAYGIEIIDE